MSYAPTAATPGGYDYQQFIGDHPTPADASSTAKAIVDETLLPSNAPSSSSYDDSTIQSHQQPSVSAVQSQEAGPAVPPKASTGVVDNAPALDVPKEAILEENVKRIPSPEEKAMYPLQQGQEKTSFAGSTRQTASNNVASTLR